MTIRKKPRTRLVAVVGALTLLGSCGHRDASPDDTGSIVLYSSQDDYVLAEAVAAFEAETGITVRVVGDTEATKTTGLVNRLLSEHEQGTSSADVWWSNEPLGTIRLSGAGVLSPYTSETAESAFAGGWPTALVGEGGTWYGHALRARVLVWSADRVDMPPVSPRELTEPRWAGRVGIARPEFGTTRGHMAALVEAWGAEAFEAWLIDLKGNGVRVYDSNSSVVRAVWMGEIDAGLTDTDDVLVGQSRGWAVGMLTRAPGEQGDGLTVPSTVGLVVRGANPAGGRAFIDWLLGGAGERVLMLSESRNAPVNPAAADQNDGRAGVEVPVPDGGPGSYERIAGRVDEAMAICERVLGGG